MAARRLGWLLPQEKAVCENCYSPHATDPTRLIFPLHTHRALLSLLIKYYVQGEEKDIALGFALSALHHSRD